ncbi:DUF1003 domain-containing protein [Belnapia sp. T18]|uniref:DUF1003 domain-containing protein n=1 Tax=Belnapia arida TaxID=2804533 RepID=A0ABS1U326_9PROT|nr:DUF1003 domain-containing protein [Belnapia arida]MBL6079084.1 DUF1003 domain-containing protein [Belnapia arida]
MPEPTDTAAHRWFGRKPRDLSPAERLVLTSTKERRVISRDIERDFDGELTFGQRLADRVAEFGGSWAFILSFGLFLLAWTLLNAVLPRPFDAYPYIFLNLLLSMIAALQAPIIMMSQNRQAVRDRLDAAHDYEVKLKAEIEIMALHEKLDQLCTREIEALLARQQEQIDLLTRLLQEGRGGSPGP